ncbi:MAG: hypothetical protein JNM56_11575 [Planctomycetia bacterium]|nr:hypothetical protein [Planctomycetia bacterium]
MADIQAPVAAPVAYRLNEGAEEFLAELTDTAYRVALRQGFVGSFIQFQLDLWSALRAVLQRNSR